VFVQLAAPEQVEPACAKPFRASAYAVTDTPPLPWPPPSEPWACASALEPDGSSAWASAVAEYECWQFAAPKHDADADALPGDADACADTDTPPLP
jgi:hypothetical protein